MKAIRTVAILFLLFFTINSVHAAKPGIGSFYGTYTGNVNGFAQDLFTFQQRYINRSFYLTIFPASGAGLNGPFTSAIPSYDGRRSYLPASSRLTYDRKRNRVIGFAEFTGSFENPRTGAFESVYGTMQTRTVIAGRRKKTFVTITLTEGSFVYYTVSGVLFK